MEYLHHLLGSLPPWAYVAIIGGGIAAAFVLPKFFGPNANASPTSASGNVTDAIDPNTGLPYPLSGYPGGALAGNNGQTTGSPDDTAALLSAIQALTARLGTTGIPGATGATGATGSTGSTGTTAVGQAPITIPSAPHVTAQPNVSSLVAHSTPTGGQYPVVVVPVAGADLAAQQRAIVENQRLYGAGV
jgi:hypothetical protein